jgi:hypothetical protein
LPPAHPARRDAWWAGRYQLAPAAEMRTSGPEIAEEHYPYIFRIGLKSAIKA